VFVHETEPLLPEPSMIRLLISAVLHLAANAVGLLVADLVLDDMSVEWQGFIVAVVFFTVVEIILEPLFQKMALQTAPALRGGSALVTTLVGLIITDVIFDDFSISGVWTWVAATVIMWLGALIAALILPLIFLRNRADARAQPAAAKGSTWAP
jgi:putative membrane protein